MEKLVIGILAHVDAGKTTLSEAMLYVSGTIRKLGRVDNRDAFLDTNDLERQRGITIFSKQARFRLPNKEVTLLDTPGHVDFSAEMERTLKVLDYAILVISGADGVQGHTMTLWNLLKKYNIPTFLFINKMDQPGCEKEALLKQLKTRLSNNCVDFTEKSNNSLYENIAVCEEQVLEQFLETETLEIETIKQLISHRLVFPCYFGSALKVDGVEVLLDGMNQYMKEIIYPNEFSALVYKISRDEAGNRLTHLKVTGGTLKVKSTFGDGEEKINQIRLYSSDKYEAVSEVGAGTICAVTGLTKSKAGDAVGRKNKVTAPVLEPVLTYQLILPQGCDANEMLPKLKQLEEEAPELNLVWQEQTKQILVKVMGDVQIEILKSLILERFGIEVEFGMGNIVYKETIQTVVEGVGHFEPLRHYAEVHLLMEPLEAGSGMVFASDVSEDELASNWQNLILTHLLEREHKGVLTGSGLTDMKITVVAGRAHQKHTEGGDFRQATYRAIRQGLMQAESVLLEPFYSFVLEVPDGFIGKAMTDIDRMHGTFEISHHPDGTAELKGMAPVSLMRNYHREVIAYTKGHGRLTCTVCGYRPCQNQEEVISEIGYDANRDVEFPSSSVFCSHGSGFVVEWDQVSEYMHIPSYLEEKRKISQLEERDIAFHNQKEISIGTDEIDAILERTFYANKKNGTAPKNGVVKRRRNPDMESVRTIVKKIEKKEDYLLVDGYNIIFAWDELRSLADATIDGARHRLMDILSNYQGIRNCKLIVVFDAYRLEGHQTEVMKYHNIDVVYTKEAETADQYIEKFAHQHAKDYNVTVATSDGLEQIIIRSKGCLLLSARELKEEIETRTKRLVETYATEQPKQRNYLLESMDETHRETLNKLLEEEQ